MDWPGFFSFALFIIAGGGKLIRHVNVLDWRGFSWFWRLTSFCDGLVIGIRFIEAASEDNRPGVVMDGMRFVDLMKPETTFQFGLRGFSPYVVWQAYGCAMQICCVSNVVLLAAVMSSVAGFGSPEVCGGRHLFSYE